MLVERQEVLGSETGTCPLLAAPAATRENSGPWSILVADFPTLTEEDVRAAIAFAAASAAEDLPVPAIPGGL
jgi:hypothetical protein